MGGSSNSNFSGGGKLSAGPGNPGSYGGSNTGSKQNFGDALNKPGVSNWGPGRDFLNKLEPASGRP